MRLVFTGTQTGMSPYQLETVRKMLTEATPDLIIHGGCIGVDFEVDIIATTLEIPREVFPSNISAKRATLPVGVGKVKVHEPMAPLERNKLMVDLADGVIACPKQETEVQRSGTWATIRYARKKLGSDKVIVIRP